MKSPTAGGTNAFDIAKLFIEGTRTGDLNAYLHTVRNFQGSCGTYSASGLNDFLIGATTKVIKSGKAVP